MKGRESGMPEEALWESFYNAPAVLEKLVLPYAGSGDVVEFGSGYGTFTIPLSQRISGCVHGFDIEPGMLALVQQKAEALCLTNVKLQPRDFMENGTGLPEGKASHAMLYNILHIETPERLLTEAYRVLETRGTLSIMHWRSDIPTPRGPALAIRPTPLQCRQWAEYAGFVGLAEPDLSDCSQYHFGFVLEKEA